MRVFEFIIANWSSILLIVAAVAIITISIFKGNKSIVMRILYALVNEAEHSYGSGTGSLKLAAVIDAIYPNLPAVVKIFITDKTLVKWVEEALTVAREAWNQNAAIAEYVAKPADTVAEK